MGNLDKPTIHASYGISIGLQNQIADFQSIQEVAFPYVTQKTLGCQDAT